VTPDPTGEVDEETVHHEVYRDGRVHVLESKCASCIFRSVNDGRIQGLAPGRVGNMVLDARRAESVIPCHMTIYDDEVQPAICRGYFDNSADSVPALRLAQLMGLITYDAPPSKE
jgi:hypothetical protein